MNLRRSILGPSLACVLAGAVAAIPAEAKFRQRSAVAANPAAASAFRADGAEVFYPTTGNDSAQNPAFSPDGKTLIFTRYTDGYDGAAGGVLKMPAEGGKASALWDMFDATNVNGLASWNGPTNRVAFAITIANGANNIATVESTGAVGTYKQITHAPGQRSYLEPTYSPDGRTIAFESDLPDNQSDDGAIGTLYLVSASGGPVTPLVTGGDDRLPVFSPDGKLILFQRRTDLTADYHLFTIDPATKAITQITGIAGTATAGDNCDSDASWTPDGHWILDSACYGAIPEDNIYMISPDGKRLLRVTNNGANEDGAPAMSPDGRWVYFESHRGADNTPSQIWRIPSPRRDGSVLVYQPDAPNAAQNPCFSPTSSTLALTIFHSYYNNGDAGIFTIPPTGGNPTTVFNKVGHDAVNLPGACWNANAGRIAFSSDINAVNGDEIWTIKPDGTAPTQVTHHSTSDIYIEPSYSPNGLMLAFEKDLAVNNDNNQRASILLVSATGASAPTVLVNGPQSNTDNREPNWSPDGNLIVFQRRAPGGHYQLYTIAPNGVGLTRLTNQLVNDNTDPSWSPDSRAVVYSSDYDPSNPSTPMNNANLFVIPATGGTPTRLTEQPLFYDGAPSWSPDGRWVAYETGFVDPPVGDPLLSSIWRIPAPKTSALK